MTFRSRVITATVGVAATAVILACFASFLTTRSALLRSVDESLLQAAHTIQDRQPGDDAKVTGSFSEIVLANGQTFPSTGVPIDQAIRNVAQGTAPQFIRSVVIRNESYRELIVPLPSGTLVACTSGLCQLNTPAAQLLVVNITGQVTELRNLVRTLLLVAIAGLLLALGLGLVLARMALYPLERVTNEIETVAETSDMTYQLDEGGADELGRLRRVFNRLLRTVLNSQTLQRQLVLDASHELRTPLTSLRTNAQILSRANLLSADDVRQVTDDMVAQVDELASLVTDLGELARGERSEGTIETLRLDECVDECVDTARTHARVKEITVEVDVAPCSVQGRRDRLLRAISNLLTNAVKFTPVGGRILVRVHDGILTVSDSGPGVATIDQPFVFDRFWRSPTSRSLPGSGLGLSIVDQVVRELGGTVKVDQDPELGGARFTMTLPTLVEH